MTRNGDMAFFGNKVNIAARDRAIIDGEVNRTYVDEISASVWGKVKTMLENEIDSDCKLAHPIVEIVGDEAGFIVEAKFTWMGQMAQQQWYVRQFDETGFHMAIDRAVHRALVNWRLKHYEFEPIIIDSNNLSLVEA